MAQAKQNTRDTEDLMKEVAALREDFGAIAKELKSLAGAERDNMSSKAAERVVALKSAGERRLEDASEMATNAAHGASDFVKDHPATSIAGAAALGFLFGALTSRR